MNMIDSIGHPTSNGSWLDKGSGNTFSNYVAELESAGFSGACVVGLHGVDGYDHRSFMQSCRPYPQLFPVAGFDPFSEDLAGELRQIVDLGFRAIKIHPRFSHLDLDRDQSRLMEIFQACSDLHLTIFLCTFLHGQAECNPLVDPVYSLTKLIKKSPDLRLVLLHGGDVQILRYSELVRYNKNLLLDLSFTLLRYQGSSLDLDLQYLCRTLDRRICIGSDWPEYKLPQLRVRVQELCSGLSEEKIRNICHKNLIEFLKWTPS